MQYAAPRTGYRNTPTRHTGLALALLIILLTAIALLAIRQKAAAGRPGAHAVAAAERLPIIGGGFGGVQNASRTAELLPGQAKDYVFGVDAGHRFSVAVSGPDNVGMRFRVTAPSENRPLIDAPVTKTPYDTAGIASVPEDVTIHVSRSASSATPKQPAAPAQYLLRVVVR